MSDALNRLSAELENPPAMDLEQYAKQTGLTPAASADEKFKADPAHVEMIQQAALAPAPAPAEGGGASANMKMAASGGVVGSIMSDAAKGVAKGAVDALQNAWNATVDISNWMDKSTANWGWNHDVKEDTTKVNWSNKITAPDDGFVTNASREITKMGAPIAAAVAMGGGPLISLATGAGIDMTLVDPHQKRLSTMILEKAPELKNWAVVGNSLDYVSNNPGETDMEGRWKNGLESLGIGAAVVGTFGGLLKFSNAAKKYLDATKVVKIGEGVAAESKALPAAANVAESTFDHPMFNASPVVDGKPNLSSPGLLDHFGRFMQEHPMAGKEYVPTTDAALLKEAQAIVQDPARVEAMISRKAGERALTAPEIEATHILRDTAHENVMAAVDRAALSGLPEDIAHAVNTIDAHRYITATKDSSGSSAGLAMRSLQQSVQEVSGLSLADYMKHLGKENEKKMLTDFLEKSGGMEVNKDVIDKIAAMRGAGAPKEAIDAVVQKSLPGKMADAAANVALSGMLGLKTAPANLLSNAYTMANSVATNGMAFVLGKARQGAVIMGNPVIPGEVVQGLESLAPTLDVVTMKQQTGYISGMMNGLIDGLSAAGHSIGASRLPVVGEKFVASPVNTLKLDFRPKAISGEAFGLDKSENLGIRLFGKIVDGAGMLSNVGSKLNSTADSFAGTALYLGKMNEIAVAKGEAMGLEGAKLSSYVEYFQSGFADLQALSKEAQAAGLSGVQAEGYVKQSIGTDKYREFMDAADSARDFAQTNTFSKALDPKSFPGKLDAALDAPAALPGAIGEVAGPLARVVVPYFKTNANIISYSIAHSPLGLIPGTQTAQAIMRGGKEGDIAMAKAINGTAFLGVATYLAAQGLTTGGTPANYRLAKALEESGAGYQANSFKTSNGYVAFNRVDPMASVLRLGHTLALLSGKLGAEEYQNLAASVGTAIADFMTPEMMVESFANTLSGYSDMVKKGEDSKAGVQVAADFVGRFTPAGAIQRDIESFLEPYKGSTAIINQDRGWLDKVTDKVIAKYKSQSPWFSNDVPVDRNFFAEPLAVPPGVGPDLISPLSETSGKNSPLVQRLQYLTNYFKEQSPMDPDLHPLEISLPSRTLKVDGVALELTPKEYERYQMYMGGYDPDTEEAMGMTLREEMDAKVDMVWSQIDGASMNADQYNKIVGSISKVIIEHKDFAKKMMMKDDGLIERWSKRKERMQQVRDVTPNLGE